MRFTINREEFLKALGNAGRAVSSKSPSPILLNFKLELTDIGLYITGSNLDLTIKTLVPFKRNETELIRNYKEGATLINAKITTEIIRQLDSTEVTVDVVDSSIVTISNSHSEFTLNCINAEDYPHVDLEPTGVKITLSKETLDMIVNQTAFAASTKEQRPQLTALNLEKEGNILTVTATDSARLARKTIPVEAAVDFVSNVPARMMVEVDHLLEGLNEVAVSFSEQKALFEINGTLVATRLIPGDYPNTKNIVPKNINYTLQVNSYELIKAISRANVMACDRENVVDLSMSSDAIEISAKSAQIGSGIERLDAFKYEGEPLKISFNSAFVVEAVKALNSDDVTFEFVGEMRPFVIRNIKDDSVVQVVTPVRSF